MDRGAWWATVHGVAKSRTRLGDFPFTFHFPSLEKEMATHSSILARRTPWTEEPGGLQSIGSKELDMKVKSESEVTQLCPTLWNPMNHSPPGPFVHGIFQARVLEWIAISFSRGSS